jgi:hypothetical protein
MAGNGKDLRCFVQIMRSGGSGRVLPERELRTSPAHAAAEAGGGALMTQQLGAKLPRSQSVRG